MRAPPESLRPMTGQPILVARSITLQIFCAYAPDSDPPNTVKSCANTHTGRPSTVPCPVTTPSPRTFCSCMPKSAQRWVTNLSSSTKLPSSSSAATRSRAVSFPASCCLAIRAWPPASCARASISSRRRMGSFESWRVTAYSRRVANVKGSALASRVLWVQLEHGPAGLARVREAASPPLAETLAAGVAKARWYPLDQFFELNVLIDRLFGRGDLELVKELGRHSAEANLTTIYRLFYKVGTAQWILGRAIRLWSVHY